jgi:hypothetical protein
MSKRLLTVGCGVLLAGLALVATLLVATRPGRVITEAMRLVFETDELDGKPLETDEQVLAYLNAHPDRYALALWDVGDEAGGVFHDPDTAWPLASTVKILPMALASEKLASGEWSLSTPTPEVESFYVAGTDGNAHPDALRSLDGGTATLGNALSGMILFSDNAATDAVLFRLGRPALEEGGARFGIHPPHPLTGTMWVASSGFDGGSIDDAAWTLAERFSKQAPVAAPELSLKAQEAMGRAFDNRGTARAFARLIERLFTDATPTYQAARERLSWPMQFPSNQKDFKVRATKGGNLQGVITSASYAESKSGHRRVLALFLHDLPFATSLKLSANFAHQKLERRLLLDDDAVAWLRGRLH